MRRSTVRCWAGRRMLPPPSARFSGRHRRGRRRRCRWRAGPGKCGRGRSALSCVGRRVMRLTARRSGTPASRAAVNEWVAQGCAVRWICSLRPGERRGARSAGSVPVHSLPVGSQEDRAGDAFAMARSMVRAVRGARGMVTIFPPLRRTVRVRCPRSMPGALLLAPSASETRSPLIASREISACSFA